MVDIIKNLEEVGKQFKDENIHLCVPKTPHKAFEYLANMFPRFKEDYEQFCKGDMTDEAFKDNAVLIETALCRCEYCDKELSQYNDILNFGVASTKEQAIRNINVIIPLIEKAINEKNAKMCNYLYIFFASCFLWQ